MGTLYLLVTHRLPAGVPVALGGQDILPVCVSSAMHTRLACLAGMCAFSALPWDNIHTTIFLTLHYFTCFLLGSCGMRAPFLSFLCHSPFPPHHLPQPLSSPTDHSHHLPVLLFSLCHHHDLIHISCLPAFYLPHLLGQGRTDRTFVVGIFKTGMGHGK